MSCPAFPPLCLCFLSHPVSPGPSPRFPSSLLGDQTHQPAGDLVLHETFPKKTKKSFPGKCHFKNSAPDTAATLGKQRTWQKGFLHRDFLKYLFQIASSGNDFRGQLWNTGQFQMDSDFWFLRSQPLPPGDHPGISSQAQAEPLSRAAKESSCLQRVRKYCWFLPPEEPAQPLSGCHHYAEGPGWRPRRQTVIRRELPSLIIQVTEIYNFTWGIHSGVIPFAHVRYNHVDVIRVTVMPLFIKHIPWCAQ